MNILNRLSALFRLNDSANEKEVIEGIEKSVKFQGAKLWILICAIFTASLGLNTNSTAVIIGAMLISPLMGPILGMGVALAINDFKLLNSSWKNFIVATLFSIITATLYFLITPVAKVQSELLARTSPSIYDVFIAICGGFAGIIALCSKSQRAGNVIPGVAIATALMPPLCTVGFGIATAHWSFALGALYLFVINSIFIALSTYIGAAFIMKFRKHEIDNAKERWTKRIAYTLSILTLIPAIILTFNMVQKNYFEQQVSKFIQKELNFPNSRIVEEKIDFSNRSFSVAIVGDMVDSLKIEQAKSRLYYYNLEGSKIEIVQASFADIDKAEIDKASLIGAIEVQQKQYIKNLTPRLMQEARTLFPEITNIAIATGSTTDGTKSEPVTIVFVTLIDELIEPDYYRLETWLKQRIDLPDILIKEEIIQKETEI